MMMMMGCDDHTGPNIWHSSGDGVPREAIKKKKTSFRNTGAQFVGLSSVGQRIAKQNARSSPLTTET